MVSRGAFSGFQLAAFFSAKHIPVAIAIIFNPSLTEPSILFFQSKHLIYLAIMSKACCIALV